MSIPETSAQMRAWLTKHIAPLNSSESDARFTETVYFGKGAATYPVNTGKKQPMSLHALFNAIVLHTTRFDDIRIGSPETRRVSVDRQTLKITELPVPPIR